jgi:pimeloyl-ACP methyl ester carboxylesterase
VSPLGCQVLRIVTVALCLTSQAASGEVTPDRDAFTVSRDDKAGTVTIAVPSREGRVYWSDVVVALSDVADVNGEVISGLIPKGSFDPDSSKAWWTVFGINAAARGKVKLKVARVADDDGTSRPTLEIVAQRSAFRDAKASLRTRKKPTVSIPWGLRIQSKDLRTPHRKPIVILVHGYNSRPEKLAGLQSSLQSGGEPPRVVWTFRYPNDGPIRESGELLAAELALLRKTHPDVRVTIVAHSMGGLVARTAIEDAELDPGNVGQLIMVSPPNQGSHLAYLPGSFDLLEHVAKRNTDVGRLSASWKDGLNEARSDLRPDSKFLRELNARPRNPRVRYSILLGDDAALSKEAVEEVTRLLKLAQKKSKTLTFLGPRLDPILEDPREFTRGQGDGVVAVERGRLAGVEDTIVLPFRHNAITGKLESEAERKLLHAIIERLDGPAGQ